MAEKLHYNTVSPLLLSILRQLMAASEFAGFRLVGGTGLSLLRGHRQSVDIDLFTDAAYGSVNFKTIDAYLRSSFSCVESSEHAIEGMGRSYYLGHDKDNLIKLDVYYTTDPFVWPALKKRGLRLASTEEIIAMKLDVISRNGRKKDFWDIHELIGDYSLGEMLAFHEKRYPDTHDTAEITKKLRDFSKANYDFDPDCLRGKYWELIQLDLIDFIEKGM